LAVSLLSPPLLLAGLLRDFVRRILRRPAADTHITVHTVGM
jgi:hypothetical protein